MSQPMSHHRTAPNGVLFGAAGLLMVIGIIGLGPVLGGPDAFGAGAVTHYATGLSDSTYLRIAPVRFGAYALLTAVELLFLAGVWSSVRVWASRSIMGPLVGLASAAFVAGGIAADAFSFGELIALHGRGGVTVDANLAVIDDVAATMALIEVNVCFAVVIAGLCASGWRGRQLPRPLSWYGFAAAAASAIPGFVPTQEAAFIVSNLCRLLFVAMLSVVVIRRGLSRPPADRLRMTADAVLP